MSTQYENLIAKLPPEVTQLAKKIQALPKTYRQKPKAYLVGGFVRDYLLGLESKDFDVEVYGMSLFDTKKLLEKLFPGKTKIVGKSFGIIKIHLKNFDIDVALPRTEHKTGKGYHGFTFHPNPELTLKQGSKRRDFTINSMLLDPLTSKIFDFYHGRADLKKRLLRCVNAKTFIEDPLRVYRAIQLTARFNLGVEAKTFKLMKHLVDTKELNSLSKERVKQELKKLDSKNANPGVGLALAKKLGIQLTQP